MPLLSAKEIGNHEFGKVRFTKGYNEKDVDNFLDRAQYTIKAYELSLANHIEPPTNDERTLTAGEVHDAGFNMTHFSEGYNMNEVDTFLDSLTDTLKQYEHMPKNADNAAAFEHQSEPTEAHGPLPPTATLPTPEQPETVDEQTQDERINNDIFHS